MNIPNVAVKNAIQGKLVRLDATNNSPKPLSQQNISIIEHDHTYQNIPNETNAAGKERASEPNTSSQPMDAMKSFPSYEASTGIPEEQIAEKSDGDSGYVSAMPHCSAAQDTPNLKIKSEYDSDSDVEFVSQYKLGTPKPSTPPPPPSEYRDLTIDSGSDGEWDVFMTLYKPGDLDIKPIIKMETIDSK